MASPVLRATWFASGDSQTAPDELARYLSLVNELSVNACALYRIDQGGPEMSRIASSLSRLDAPAGQQAPDWMVLTQFPSFDDAMAAEEELVSTAVESSRVDGIRLQARAAFIQLTEAAKPEADPAQFAPAVQFGTFSMQSPADEWAISNWYLYHRIPEFMKLRSAIRVRRYASVAGQPKYGILYEFTSLEDRVAEFEIPMESLVREAGNPSQEIISRTIHTSSSPTVGMKFDLER